MTQTDIQYAATMHRADFWTHIEIQVVPGKVKVYANTRVYRARRAEWSGAEAVAIGKAVCAGGEVDRLVFADWCQDHAPDVCDHDFDVPAWLRMSW